jgi:hypothetical protein
VDQRRLVGAGIPRRSAIECSEQGQLLALHLDQIGGRLVQGADRCRLQRQPKPTRAAIAATARSTRANPRVPLGIRWLASMLRPSSSRPIAPKTAATESKLLAYWLQTDDGGGLVGVIWNGADEHPYARKPNRCK